MVVMIRGLAVPAVIDVLLCDVVVDELSEFRTRYSDVGAPLTIIGMMQGCLILMWRVNTS